MVAGVGAGTYDELIESLSCLADAVLTLHIGVRKDWPIQN